MQGRNNNSCTKRLINPLACFFECHVALDRNPGPGYNTTALSFIPWGFYSVYYPHRQFYTLPGLLHTRAALPKSSSNACVASIRAVCTIFRLSLDNQCGTQTRVLSHARQTTLSSRRGRTE